MAKVEKYMKPYNHLLAMDNNAINSDSKKRRSSDLGAAVTKTYDVVVPSFGFAQYWPEIMFLVMGIAAPLVALCGWSTGEAFERSGSLSVFFAAVAEFIALNRLTKKHFLNACRAKEGETPWVISRAASYVGVAAFVVGLAGTLIWGFGSKWV